MRRSSMRFRHCDARDSHEPSGGGGAPESAAAMYAKPYLKGQDKASIRICGWGTSRVSVSRLDTGGGGGVLAEQWDVVEQHLEAALVGRGQGRHHKHVQVRRQLGEADAPTLLLLRRLLQQAALAFAGC